MATNHNSSSNLWAGKTVDVLDVMSSGIAKTAAFEPKFEPNCWFQRSRLNLPANSLSKKCSPSAGCVQSHAFTAGAKSARGRST